MSESSPPSSPPRAGGSGIGQLPKSWLLPALVLLVLLVVRYFSAESPKAPELPYSAFFALVRDARVQEVTMRGQELEGKLKVAQEVDGQRVEQFRTMIPPYEDRDLLPLLREKGVAVSVESIEQPLGPTLIYYGLMALLVLGVWMGLRRTQRMMGSGGPLGGLLKGRTRRFEREAQVLTRFDDVAGLKAAKLDLSEIVDFLKEPAIYRRLGGKVPRGVLLVGPPGTGKTLLARAVAGEAGVPFFSINGSEFIELFVGVGASRVRELFEEAKKVAPAIIFIDEIDAVGRSRGTGMGGGHDEREQTLNQLLSEMDGFTRNDQTIILAATNRPDVLDQALLRPGRFDRRVIVDRPELGARRAILEVHSKDKPLAADVNLGLIASSTPGFSGADLANLVNEAALAATRRGANAIERRDFRAAYDKIVLGDPRETRLDPEEKRRVAVHEAGHAVVAHFTDHSEPLQRITIIPRGMALGVTQQTPAADRHIMTKAELDSRLQMMMGGHAAEKVVLGDVSSGAANDLQRATELAFKMVAHFGMSEKLGPIYLEHRTEHPFLGQMIATEGGTSDATVHLVEQEVQTMLREVHGLAEQLIRQRRMELDRLVEALLDHESIECDELHDLLGSPVSERCLPLGD